MFLGLGSEELENHVVGRTRFIRSRRARNLSIRKAETYTSPLALATSPDADALEIGTIEVVVAVQSLNPGSPPLTSSSRVPPGMVAVLVRIEPYCMQLFEFGVPQLLLEVLPVVRSAFFCTHAIHINGPCAIRALARSG